MQNECFHTTKFKFHFPDINHECKGNFFTLKLLTGDITQAVIY